MVRDMKFEYFVCEEICKPFNRSLGGRRKVKVMKRKENRIGTAQT